MTSTIMSALLLRVLPIYVASFTLSIMFLQQGYVALLTSAVMLSFTHVSLFTESHTTGAIIAVFSISCSHDHLLLELIIVSSALKSLFLVVYASWFLL